MLLCYLKNIDYTPNKKTPLLPGLLHIIADVLQLTADFWSEFGVIARQSTDALRHMISAQKTYLPLQVQQCVDGLLEHINRIEDNIAEYDRILSRMDKADHRSQQLVS